MPFIRAAEMEPCNVLGQADTNTIFLALVYVLHTRAGAGDRARQANIPSSTKSSPTQYLEAWCYEFGTS